MRDKLIHAYFGVNVQLVWQTTQTDLPNLVQTVESILRTLGQQNADGKA